MLHLTPTALPNAGRSSENYILNENVNERVPRNDAICINVSRMIIDFKRNLNVYNFPFYIQEQTLVFKSLNAT